MFPIGYFHITFHKLMKSSACHTLIGCLAIVLFVQVITPINRILKLQLVNLELFNTSYSG